MMALLLTVIVSIAMTWWLTSGRSRLQIMDHPNARSLHEMPVPRSGGIAILAAVAAGWSILLLQHDTPPAFLWILASGIAVAAISLLDDLFELSARIRMLVHMLAAISLLFGGLVLPWDLFGGIVTFFTVVWMINLYNFMDGMDGFAGGMTLFGFLFLGLAGYLSGDLMFSLLCWTVVAAASGFLLFNFPPAKIFMGDTGSATIGVLAAGFSLWGIKKGIFALWYPLLVFSPFIFDATVTLLRRLLRGEKVWQAHREHYYQRLAMAGWGHKRTVLAEYILMLVGGVSAIAMLHWEQLVPYGFVTWIVIYALLAYFSERFCSSGVSMAK